MTIDNAQGQTFTTVGVDLRSHYFAHGRLYLTLSRASSSAGIKCIVGTNKVALICRSTAETQGAVGVADFRFDALSGTTTVAQPSEYI
ncbi:hypothetical protein EDB89DRAFT_934445 [Lactarius sanguifluus]|nr:hypothetical protein EDB89DRAFT_934445 [Lactarius sanguifluus]